MNSLDLKNNKNQKFGVDKIFHPLDVHFDTNSLSAWLSFYYQVHVKGAPEKTEQAKQKDILKFLNFFQSEVGLLRGDDTRKKCHFRAGGNLSIQINHESS